MAGGTFRLKFSVHSSQKAGVNILCERFLPSTPSFPFVEQVAFIVEDYRTYQESLSDEHVVLSLVQNFGMFGLFNSVHLYLSKLSMTLEHFSSTLKFKGDGPPFLHYHIYNISSDSTLKTRLLRQQT